MGKMFKIYLCGDRIYSCSTCRTHLAKHDQIVSKVCASARAGSRACGFPARQVVRRLTRTVLCRRSKAGTAGLSSSAMCKCLFWIGSRSRFASRFCLPHTSQAPTAGHHAQGHARRDIRSPALSGLDVGTHLNDLSVRRVNITLGAKEDRNLITGLHTVADVYCSSCQTILGWKYVNPLHSTSLHSVLFLRAAHAWARLELGSAFLPACVHSAGQWQRRQRNVFRDGRLCSHRSRRSRRARNTRRANAL